MPWIDGSNKKIQAFHWVGPLGLNDLKFIDGSGDPTATDYIDFLELSGAQQKTRTIKLAMGDTGGGSGSHVVYNVWFGDTVAEIEDAVANQAPTQIFFNLYSLPQPVIFTFNVSTRYMAINFDPAYGNVDPTSTFISIYAY